MVLNSVKSTTAPILRWSSDKAKNWLQTFLAEAELNPNIMSVIAIGSSIREGVSSADLDLVVLFDERLSKDFEPPPIDVDLRTFRVCDVATLVREGNDLLGWSVKFGEPLLDKNNSWQTTVQALDAHTLNSQTSSSKVPLPSAKTALERAHKTNDLLELLVKTGDLDAIYEQSITLLTHVARARLINQNVYPISRPELAGQLQEINDDLAILLREALESKKSPMVIYEAIKNLPEIQTFGRAT